MMISTRSSSFPSRKSHPQLDQHLHTLKKSKKYITPTTSFPSLSSIGESLHNLENRHNCVDDLLISPQTHCIFTRERHEKWVDAILNGYLSLVDACATARDFVFHSKEYISNLLSVLRRRRDSDDQLCKLMSSRNITKKMIQKSLRNINVCFKNKSSTRSVTNKDPETVAIISMIKEAESATIKLIQALLLSISGEKGRSRPNAWVLVSRLMRPSRKVLCQEHIDTTTLEFGDLDAILVSFRASKGTQIEEFKQQLTDMDSIIQVVEQKLECLFKHLIRSRISLLNMQSQL